MWDIGAPSTAQLEKYAALKAALRDLGSVAVAFSGGVDSAFLLFAAREALGGRAAAISAKAAVFPQRETREAREFCAARGIRRIEVPFDALGVDGFAENPRDRCYLCKRALLTRLCGIARAEGLAAVAEGSNLDDESDYRPGLRAVAELGVKSPLRDCGLTKADIRALSRHFGLPTWDKQSFACLASRFPYGEHIDRAALARVERAEQLLLDMGFTQLRVRVHGGRVARIELPPEDFPRLLADGARERVHAALRDDGFDYVALDLLGYRAGSLNETLSAAQRAEGMTGEKGEEDR